MPKSLDDIKKLVSQMTLEEKAGLCSGLDFWRTKPVERLGVPSVMVSDGPNGLRKQADRQDNIGLGGSVEAVCFPTGSALAATFDKELLRELGTHLGTAARAEKLHTVLGPAVNMKRSPLCGRNFEYMSEDPVLAGELAAAYVDGLQKEGVGVSVKHFAVNNQESNRMSVDAIVSERALREIYFKVFEIIVRKSKPWTMMCSYNGINGTYSCENSELLTKHLREEWGFDGIVMTDWGAMNDRVKALAAGLELEMPTSNGIRDRLIVEAVKSGKLDEAVLDKAAVRLLYWIFRGEGAKKAEAYSKDEQHEFSRKVAESAAVLLKNEDSVLPLSTEKKNVVIGSFAFETRYQGGGSSHVNSYRVSSAIDMEKQFGENTAFYKGWNADGETADAALEAEALKAVKTADTVVIFAGLPDSFESEGFDRESLDMPSCQNEFISKAAAVNPNVVVVLHNGSPVAMPWINEVKAVLEMNLAGEASGEAAVNLLTGKVNPSGHLAETYPLRLEDNPSFLSFPGDGRRVEYRESVYIGYRWYDSLKMPVLFPFGHGLSYTSFDISSASISGGKLSCVVKNTGERAGSAAVQLYVKAPKGKVDRPVHELKDFAKVYLEKGEEKKLSFDINEAYYSLFDEKTKSFVVPSGEYMLQLGFSSRDIRAEVAVKVEGAREKFVLNDRTTLGDVIEAGLADRLPVYVKAVFEAFGVGTSSGKENAGFSNKAAERMVFEMPVHSMANFAPVPDNYLEEIENCLK